MQMKREEKIDITLFVYAHYIFQYLYICIFFRQSCVFNRIKGAFTCYRAMLRSIGMSNKNKIIYLPRNCNALLPSVTDFLHELVPQLGEGYRTAEIVSTVRCYDRQSPH